MFLSRFHPDIAEEQSVPAEPGGEAEEDLHHPLLRLPHVLLLLAAIQVIIHCGGDSQLTFLFCCLLTFNHSTGPKSFLVINNIPF